MKKHANDMGLENQREVMRASLQEITFWLLLPLGTHIKPFFYLNLF
jgi:hypothetical protein